MKLTILSDIHEDIDKYYARNGYGPAHDFSALKEQEFVIIAGDISGNPLNVKKFIQDNISRGLFVEGNHLGYDKSGQYQIDFKQGAQRWLRDQFKDTPVKYLENDIHIEGDVVFIGCTLYTDFNLYNKTGDKNRQLSYMQTIQGGLNDFNCVKCERDGDIRTVTADDYLKWHHESVAYIFNICECFPCHKIVVITHHAPSKKSIAEQYKHGLNSKYNAGYASNLEWLIKKHKNIKLWVSGHCHSDSNYKIAQCRCIAHPYGYFNQNNRNMSKFGNRKNCLGYVIDTEDL